MRGWLNAARWCLLSSRILPHAHAYPRLALASTSGRRVFMTTPASPSSFSAAGDRAVQVGLTGSIGMGKSTISTHFRSMGFPVFDADAAVHQLYAANGAAVGPIGALFPDAIVDGAVSRPVLGKKVMEDPSVLKALEAVVHPLVAAERRAFYEAANQEGHFLVVYDIPLLLENPTSQEVDYVVVATASAETQRRRVLERPGMTEDKFMSLLAKQMPDADKRSKADFLIHTDFPSLAPARAQVASVVEALVSKHATRWAAWKSRPAAVPVKAVDTRGPIAEAFDLVVFDLDDTLVPVFNPIKPATEALFDFMAQRMPRTAVDAKDQLRPTMGQVMKDQPLMAHDLTEVRREALRVLAAPHGEDGAVDEAMQVRGAAGLDHFLPESPRPLTAPRPLLPCRCFWRCAATWPRTCTTTCCRACRG
jgi:dephospho-CoA kinase